MGKMSDAEIKRVILALKDEKEEKRDRPTTTNDLRDLLEDAIHQLKVVKRFLWFLTPILFGMGATGIFLVCFVLARLVPILGK